MNIQVRLALGAAFISAGAVLVVFSGVQYFLNMRSLATFTLGAGIILVTTGAVVL